MACRSNPCNHFTCNIDTGGFFYLPARARHSLPSPAARALRAEGLRLPRPAPAFRAAFTALPLALADISNPRNAAPVEVGRKSPSFRPDAQWPPPPLPTTKQRISRPLASSMYSLHQNVRIQAAEGVNHALCCLSRLCQHHAQYPVPSTSLMTSGAPLNMSIGSLVSSGSERCRQTGRSIPGGRAAAASTAYPGHGNGDRFVERIAAQHFKLARGRSCNR